MNKERQLERWREKQRDIDR